MASLGNTSQSSTLKSTSVPGIFGANDTGASRRIGLNIENLLGQDVGFGGRTGSENQLISELIDITGANTAVRGLGAPTAESIASSIAPTLLNLRQQKVGEKGGTAQLLLELAGLASPQVGFGTEQRSRDFGLSIAKE